MAFKYDDCNSFTVSCKPDTPYQTLIKVANNYSCSVTNVLELFNASVILLAEMFVCSGDR